MSRRRSGPRWRSRWATPAVSLVLGLVILGAHAAGGDLDDGLRAFAVMALVAVVFVVGARSETLSGLGGPGRDERWASIDMRATAFAGSVVIAGTVVAWLYETAAGRTGSPYGQLAAMAGIAYLAALAWLRWRS